VFTVISRTLHAAGGDVGAAVSPVIEATVAVGVASGVAVADEPQAAASSKDIPNPLFNNIHPLGKLV
jgi:hypothetical protein